MRCEDQEDQNRENIKGVQDRGKTNKLMKN